MLKLCFLGYLITIILSANLLILFYLILSPSRICKKKLFESLMQLYCEFLQGCFNIIKQISCKVFGLLALT